MTGAPVPTCPKAPLRRAKPLPSKDAAYAPSRPSGAQGLDIARHVIAARKLGDDPATVIMLRKQVSATLFKLKVRGWAIEVPQAGEYERWQIA